MNIQKLLSKGHLVPIYNRVEDTIMLVGYQRKASSRKASQRPFLLKAAIPIAKIPTEPETESSPNLSPEVSPEVASKNAESSPKTINEE